MLKVNMNTSNIGSSIRLEKLRTTARDMEKVLNSDNFKSKVMAFDPIGETSKWKNASGLEIYRHIMTGSEVLSPEVDLEVDIEVVPYFSFKRVIGYTYPSVAKIYFNTRYFDARTTKLIGSTCLHEYGHKLGFKHAFKRTKTRHLSIPYLLNKAYEESYSEIFSTDKISKIRVCTGWWIFKKCRWVNAS